MEKPHSIRKVEDKNEPEKLRALPFGMSDGVMTASTVIFLIVSLAIWLSVDSSGATALYYVLFLIPNYLCAEWICSKIFHKNSSLSTANSGFSIVRIIVGTLFVLAVGGVIYAIGLLTGQ